MALKAEEVYGALTSYVDDTLKGAGALKGAPCTIKNIVKVGDENTVTFEWTKVDGNKDTSDMLVNDGATPVSAVIDADKHVIFTMSDGRNIDGGELPQAKVEISKEAGNALAAKEDGLFVAKGAVEISAEEGNIIKSKADGLYAKADEIKKSAKTDNILTIETDGLFVPKTTDNNYSDVEKKQVSDNKDAIAKLNDNASVVGPVADQIADALGKLNKLEKRIVSVLPAIADADANTIYLIKQGATSSNYDMYTLVTLADGSKSLASMGGTEIDLDGYLKTDDAKTLYLALADVDKDTLSNLSTIKETIAGVEVLSLAFNGTKLVKPSDLNDYVAKEQGAVNVGKSLIVGADGKVTLGNAQIDIATTFGTTPSDDKVPSEKLVKDSLDAKATNLAPNLLAGVGWNGDWNYPTMRNTDGYTIQVADAYMLAPLWNGTDTFFAGNYRRHNNKLYRVLKDCTGVEPPNAEYYVETRIGGELLNKVDKSELNIIKIDGQDKTLQECMDLVCVVENFSRAEKSKDIYVRSGDGFFVGRVMYAVNKYSFSGYLVPERDSKLLSYSFMRISNNPTILQPYTNSNNLYGSDEYNPETTYGPVGNTSGFPSYCIANGRLYECLVQVQGAKPFLNGGSNWKWLSLSELNSNLSNLSNLHILKAHNISDLNDESHIKRDEISFDVYSDNTLNAPSSHFGMCATYRISNSYSIQVTFSNDNKIFMRSKSANIWNDWEEK